jgi:hypothetical protein
MYHSVAASSETSGSHPHGAIRSWDEGIGAGHASFTNGIHSRSVLAASTFFPSPRFRHSHTCKQLPASHITDHSDPAITPPKLRKDA